MPPSSPADAAGVTESTERTESRQLGGAAGAAGAAGAVQPPTRGLGWLHIRRGAYAVYVAALAWLVIAEGVPTGRTILAVLIVSGLAISRLGHGWQALAQVPLDWLPFTAVLMLYDRTRGIADSLGFPLHERDVLAADRSLFGGVEPTVLLQHLLYEPLHIHWYDVLCSLVYTSHFVVTPALAAALWLRHRREWLRFISRVVALSVAGLATYCVFPEAPPWLASRDGLMAPVARLSARGWIPLHLGDVSAALRQAQHGGSNPVAAMPSLHLAFAVLATLVVMERVHSRWRRLLVLYPAAMAFTLVYTGEHYVLDLLAGVGYALAVHLALRRWEARRASISLTP